MKRPTTEAARSLGLHPANLLLYLAGMGAEFGDVWPEVDDVWIDELRRQNWDRFGRPAASSSGATPPPPPPPASLGVSEAAAKVIAKLNHKRFWGSHTVNHEVLRNVFCQSIEGFDDALEELLQKGLLRNEGRRGPYSLNESHSKEIERIALASGIRKD